MVTVAAVTTVATAATTTATRESTSFVDAEVVFVAQ